MTKENAETAITTSALVVASMFTYRKLTEKGNVSEPKRKPGEVVKGLIGTNQLLPVGSWVTGAGVTFIVLSILGSIAPNVGGYGAILVATGSTLGNGIALTQDISHKVSGETKQPAAKTSQELAERVAKEKNVPLFSPLSSNHPPTHKVVTT